MSGISASSRERTVGSHSTQSPGFSLVASGPTSRTSPIAPQPGTTGVGSRYLRAPLKTSSAYGSTGAATTSTMTSPVPIVGSGTSLRVSGVPNASSTAAFMSDLLRLVVVSGDAPSPSSEKGWYDPGIVAYQGGGNARKS